MHTGLKTLYEKATVKGKTMEEFLKRTMLQ